jgi:PBSX family phage terminase large subunit
MIERLNPKQKYTVRDSDARINLWSGAVRSGKTIAVDFRILQAYGESKVGLPPDALDMIIGKTVSSLKRNVINPLIELVGSDNAKYYANKMEFHLFDNIIHVIGANDERSENKIRGATVRKVLGDEVTLWPESFFEMLDSRLTTPKSQMFLTTNPGSPKHYLKTRYIDRCDELDMKYYHFRLSDNKALDPKVVQALKTNFTGTWYKRFIEGLWVAAEGAIYDFFDDREHCIVRHPQAEYYVVGCDFGISNPTVYLLCGVNRKAFPRVWVEQEYYSRKTGQQKEGEMVAQKTTSELAEDFKDFCKEHLGEYWRHDMRAVYMDPSAEALQVEFEKAGIPVVEAVNDVIPGIATTSIMIKNGHAAIMDNCKTLQDEIYGYSWDKKAQERGLDEPRKVDDHGPDALRYVLQTEFGEDYVDLEILGRM